MKCLILILILPLFMMSRTECQDYTKFNSKNSKLLLEVYKEGFIDDYIFNDYAKNNYDVEIYTIIKFITLKVGLNSDYNKLKFLFQKFNLLNGSIDSLFRLESNKNETEFKELLNACRFASIKDFCLNPEQKIQFIKTAVKLGYLDQDISLENRFLNNEIGYADIFDKFNNLIPLNNIDTVDKKAVLLSMVNFFEKAFNYNLPHVKVSYDECLVNIHDRNFIHKISIEEAIRTNPHIPDYHFRFESKHPLSPSVRIYQNLLGIVNQIAADNNLEYKSKILTSWKLMDVNSVFNDELLLNQPFLQITDNKIYLLKNLVSATNEDIILSKSQKSRINPNQIVKISFVNDRIKDNKGVSPFSTYKKVQLTNFFIKYQREFNLTKDQLDKIANKLQKLYIYSLFDIIRIPEIEELNLFSSDFELLTNEQSYIKSGEKYNLSEIFPNLYTFTNGKVEIKDITYNKINYTMTFKMKKNNYSLNLSSTNLLDFIVENYSTNNGGKQLLPLKNSDYYTFMKPQMFQEFQNIIGL